MSATDVERRRAVAKQSRMVGYQKDQQEYELLEQRGFKNKFYPRHRKGGQEARWDRYIGKSFKILGRVFPMEHNAMWVIEFADGFRMAANRWEVLN